MIEMMKTPTDTEIDESLARVNKLKPIDLISILMQARNNLEKAHSLTSDVPMLKNLQDLILSNCTTMANIDMEHPDKSDIIQMMALFLMDLAKIPVNKKELDLNLN